MTDDPITLPVERTCAIEVTVVDCDVRKGEQGVGVVVLVGRSLSGDALVAIDRRLLLRDLPETGLGPGLGSDGPLNPWLSLLAAITTPNRPDQALTREEAVTAYTQGSAAAEFAEHEKGTLEAGKLADLAVLDRDVFTIPENELTATTSLLTLVGGKVVWAQKPFDRNQ